jgi:hypothetical protein
MSCPVDWWCGCLTFDQYVATLQPKEIAEAKALLEKAKAHADQCGWEGDMVEGPFVFGVPPRHGYNTFDVGFAWKQDNNGTTYVVSPVPMPWLEPPDVPAARYRVCTSI